MVKSNTAPIRAMLFDMDDTLIDWHGFDTAWDALERVHMLRVVDYLEQAGQTLHASPERIITTYREAVIEGWQEARETLRAPHQGEIMERVLSQFGYVSHDDCTIDHCLRAYDWQGAPDVVVFPDVHQGLQALLDQNIKIGILTNAFQPMWVREAELHRFDLMGFFEDMTTVSAADAGYLKPHPAVFEYALNDMGTTAAETLYVGDNPVADIVGAQGAGMRAALRVNHGNMPTLAPHIQPDYTITSLLDLLELI